MRKKTKGKKSKENKPKEKSKEFDAEETFNAGENKVMEEADKLEKDVMKQLQGR